MGLGALHFNSRYQRRVVVTEGGAPEVCRPVELSTAAGSSRRLKFQTKGRERLFYSSIKPGSAKYVSNSGALARSVTCFHGVQGA
jgi:hypothetical protein